MKFLSDVQFWTQQKCLILLNWIKCQVSRCFESETMSEDVLFHLLSDA